jgi:GNAT superfamily N-acetyltransferase
MSAITIRSVRARRDENDFIRFQWKIYEGDPYWVPPLLMDRRKLIDRKRNPFYEHAEMELFLAERDGEVVGRIGAIINHNHNKEHNENIGFFGFFEAINDRSVSTALFDAAKHWLSAHGVKAMRGPASPSVNDEYGMLIDGFDKSPYVLMTYNPEYYPQLVETYGFVKAKDLYAYEVHKDTVFTPKLVRVAEAVKRREGLVLRSLNMKRFDEEVLLIRDLYNRGWERNWGEVPMTDAEFKAMARDLKPVVEPDLVIIAEVKGKPVGFALSLPDLNRVFIRNKKGYLIPGLVRLFLYKKTIDAIRIIVLGVLPEYLNSGIGGLLFYETGRRAVEHGYPHGEASWVLEDNVMMNRGAQLMNGVRTKTYRVYQLPL